MTIKQDLFISHASADKERYVLPLTNALTNRGVSFWLDSLEIQWGDNFVAKINDGLRSTRFALLCLSKNFLNRSWSETEMASVLAIQNSKGVKRVLPLICDSKARIIQKYPLLMGFAYREFKSGIDSIVEELVMLTGQKGSVTMKLQVIIESVHTERISNLSASPRTSVRWLVDKAVTSFGVKREADIGAYKKYPFRWVLVDAKADEEWERMSTDEMLRTKMLIKLDNCLKASAQFIILCSA